jgi:hypothetical protein
MVLRTAHIIFNYQMITNAGDNIIIHPPSMGPINDVSSAEKLTVFGIRHITEGGGR